MGKKYTTDSINIGDHNLDASMMASLNTVVSNHGSYITSSDAFSGNYNDLTNKPTIPSLSGYATQSYVTTQINNLVASAPGSLNTLNELAAALGDDANFSTTVTNSIAAKLPLTGGTITGNLRIENGSPKIYLKDTTDDDDQAIYFQNNASTIEYIISTQDFTTSGLGDGMFIGSSSNDKLALVTNNTTALTLDTSQNASLAGGLTISGSLSRSTYTSASNYHAGADNIVLKGNNVGISGIFFESEKNGTNINHSSDFGFIQYHAYGTGTSGESNELVIGVSNDIDDQVILNAPHAEGLRFRVGSSETDYKIYHEGHKPTASEIGAALSSHSHSWSSITGKPTTFAPSSHNHDDRYYTESESNSRFVNVAGDTMTGNLTVPQIITTHNGAGTNVKIGDDAWIGDTNVANTIQITGSQDGTKGYIVFGSSDNMSLGRSGTGNLTYGGYSVFHDNYHPNADKWTTARTLSLSGDASGSVSWDGSANATLSVAVNNDSHYHSQIYIPDTRGASRAPSYYPYRYTSFDFQNNSDTGAGGDSWHVLQTVVPWSSYNSTHRQQQIAFTGTGGLKFRYATSSSAWASWQTLWTSGNDGSGSGLDADKLDGQHGSYYYPASNPNGYTSNTGDITGITAGGGLTGGGTSGTVTLSHTNTSSQSSVNNSSGTVIQDITLDTYGHITGLASYNLDGRYYTKSASDSRYYLDSNPDGYTSNIGDITAVTAGTNLNGGGTSGAVTLNLNSNINLNEVNIGQGIELKESSDRADLLQITSATSSWAGIQIRNSADDGRWSFMTDGATGGFYDDQNNDWAVQMIENGAVGLRHNGIEKFVTTSAGVQVYGNLTVSSNVYASNFILQSDKRLKTKITDLPCNNIDVNWKSFEIKEEEGDYRTGVIAQELEETHPEFVNTDSNGFKSVKYIDLLIAKIAELEARLDKLEK